MLAEEHHDRRQLSYLMAPEPLARLMLLLAEHTPASAALLRVVINDLIYLVLR